MAAGLDFAAADFGVEFAARAAIRIAAHTVAMKNVRRNRRDILRLNSGERDCGEEQALQAQFTAARIVPFGGGVRAAAFSAAAEGNGGDGMGGRGGGGGGGWAEGGG